MLKGRWLHIIVVNVHAPSEEKSEEVKDSFYEEIEVFDHFPKYYMKILLGDFNAKLGRKDIFKPIIGQESLHQDSNMWNNDTPQNIHLLQSAPYGKKNFPK